MAKLIVNGLTPLKVKRETRPGYYADGNNLYLLVAKNGQGYFVWRGKVQGHKYRREIGIGPARQVSLADARETARQWCQIARAGGDPKAERDKAKKSSLSFEDAARHVHREQVLPHSKSAKHAKQWLTTLKTHAFPVMGARPVHAVAQADVLQVLAPIWTEKPEIARRVRQRIRTVLDWARTAGHREGVNPVEGVDKGLPKQRHKTRHHTALPYAELPDLMHRLEAEDTIPAAAMRFIILTAARSGEARGATWTEMDLGERVWTIPAERMKTGEPHRVPLSDTAVTLLEGVRGLSDGFVFPGKKPGKRLSDTTLRGLLDRLDVSATTHGFRSSFRDWSEEMTSFSYEIKERALAHAVKNPVERAYRRGDLFEQRRALMDQWARFCTSGSQSGKVVELRA